MGCELGEDLKTGAEKSLTNQGTSKAGQNRWPGKRSDVTTLKILAALCLNKEISKP